MRSSLAALAALTLLGGCASPERSLQEEKGIGIPKGSDLAAYVGVGGVT